jgi:hypothetical protein
MGTSGQNKAAKNEPEVGCHTNNNFFISNFQVLDHFLHLQHFAEEKKRAKFDTHSRKVQRIVAQPRRHKLCCCCRTEWALPSSAREDTIKLKHPQFTGISKTSRFSRYI